MPVSDVLRGFIGEAAQFADQQRVQQRQREDDEIGNQQALIRAYMEHPNVNPEMLGKMMEDYMSLGKAKAGPRKGKGGMQGFMGGTDTPISTIIQGLHSGEFLPMEGNDQGQPGGGPPQPQPAPSGNAPAQLGPQSGKVGGGAPADIPTPPAGGVPQPPTASMAGTPGATSPALSQATGAVAAAGPSGSKGTPLLLSPSHMAQLEGQAKAASAYGTETGKLQAITAQMKTMVDQGLMSPAEAKLWGKKQLGAPVERFQLKPMVDPSDQTQTTRWAKVGDYTGVPIDPRDGSEHPEWIPSPQYQHITQVDPGGNVTYTYLPLKPGGLQATGGVPTQVSGGQIGKEQFQPVTPVVTTGPGGSQTTMLVPHAVAGRGGAATAAAIPAPPASGGPAATPTVPQAPAKGAAPAGPTVTHQGGMTSITGTKWDDSQKQIVDSITQAAPMVARVEAALSKQYGGDPSQYPNDFNTKMHEFGQTAAYAVGQQPSDPTFQTIIPLVSFLKTFLTQPYLRGIRNMQYIEQIQNHMPHVSPIPDSPQLMASKIAIIKENLGGIMNELGAPNPFGSGGSTIPPPPAAQSASPSTTAPKVNEKRTINGTPAMWDGKGWKATP